jgi:hypothetical protein
VSVSVAAIAANGDRMKALEAAILDIDAHASPLGEDVDGFVAGGYIISVGSLHRALGLIGHTSRRCKLCGTDEHACATTLLEARAANDYLHDALLTIAGAMGAPTTDADGEPLVNFQLLNEILQWVGIHRTTCHPPFEGVTDAVSA